MPLFLTDTERAALVAGRFDEPLARVFTALRRRVERRAESPTFQGPDSTVEWWHAAGEYLTDAAMIQALAPTERTAAWLRASALAIARRPEEDWVGPFFRDRQTRPALGHLETAHLCWGLAAVLDLAPDIFAASERDEIAEVLAERGVPMCLRWLDRSHHLANWRCVLTAGVAVPAAVLGLTEPLARAASEFQRCSDAFQPDGSYAESLQYGHYALLSLMLVYEALVRREPARASELSVERYAGYARWAAASFLYLKPLAGWGAEPRPRSVNFNDAAALFVPGGDVLCHLAARAEGLNAGLARWLFDTVHLATGNPPPYDRATFGFVNDIGWLTLPLLTRAAAAIAPESAGLAPVQSFSCGDVIARDTWGGQTVLAVHGGGDPLHGPGHLHGDLNSFILAHRNERLLVDPGHACYRNLLHAVECSTRTHNSVTFQVTGAGLGLQEDLAKAGRLQQSSEARRALDGPPVDRGARRLLVARSGDVTAIAAEAAALYGRPIEEFSRLWLLAGSQVLFVIDRIRAAAPVKADWHWLLNNRDGRLDLRTQPPRALTALRGEVGLRLVNLTGGRLAGPTYAHVHDAYHPLPAQLGEGRPGSGWLMDFSASAAPAHLAVHALVVDTVGQLESWTIIGGEGEVEVGRAGGESWRLTWADEPLTVTLNDRWRVTGEGDEWRLSG